MPIPKSTIDTIRDRADIAEIVEQYVDLKRSGTRLKGLCPFHSEKTPSFFVNPDMQMYHCFGCGQGGGVFDFVMEIEGVTFPEAVRALGQKVGVEVESKRIPVEERSRNDALYEANAFVARFYHRQLVDNPAAKATREYLEARGIPRQAWTHFGLGYAPDAWDGLVSEARKAQVPSDLLTQLKLITSSEKSKGYFDYFRNRLMFPIVAPGGRVVAFGARALADGDEPKYLNSTESPIFVKRCTLYGLDRARAAIRTERCAIIVEGYTDLISLHLSGIEHTVATCGTALSTDHAGVLRRMTQRVILFPDADAAGQTAAATTGGILLGAGLDVSVVVVDAGLDPDAAARKMGPEKLKETVGGAMDYFHYLDYITKDRAMSPREQEGLIRRVIAGISDLDDRLRYDLIIKDLARVLGVAPASLAAARPRTRGGGASAEPTRKTVPEGPRLTLERLALRLLMEGTPAAVEAVEALDEEDFSGETHRKLYNLLDAARDSHIDTRSRDFQRRAEENGLAGLAAEIALISVPPGNVETFLKDTIRRIKELKIRDELAVLRDRLSGLPADSDEARSVAEYYQKLKQALSEL